MGSSNNTIASSEQHHQLRFALANSLQTSLDLQETLAAFYKALQPALQIGGLSYKFDAKKLQFCFGNDARHSATYHLHVQDTALGTITLTRSRKFAAEELALLENFSGLLVYPLRNALLYREALENSLRDPLTQIGNRAALELNLKRELKLSLRSGDPLALLVIDIDHFKAINDTAGHSFGDHVICQIARTISDTLRQTDQVFRFGGEEYVVILSNTSHRAALAIAERLRRSVENLTMENKAQRMPVTISVGVACSAENDTRDKLIQRADDALYLAKQTGRNRVVSQALATEQLHESLKTG